MKMLLTTAFALSTLSASAAFITYADGITNVENASGPSWVSGTSMFREIIADYAGAPKPSGATGATQSGIDLFNPGGGGLDITLLSWQFTTLSLMNPGDGDSLTTSPGPATPGFEDYRYDTLGGAASTNLTFYYDGDEWASGYITQFVIEVDNDTDFDAFGTGSATITTSTVAGLAFFNAVSLLTGGSMELDFLASSFVPVIGADPGSFGSAGQINIVPEPGTYAMIAGALALGIVALRRRK